MLNRVTLIGRLAADPELQDRSGTPVGRLRLAVQRRRARDGQDQGADFIDVVVFNAQAEACASYLQKGRLVSIDGRLRHHQWQAEDGSRRQKLEVVADAVEFLDLPRREQPTAEPARAAA